jgi:predicted  nucleic acid-binding Zn-ribbon protein
LADSSERRAHLFRASAFAGAFSFLEVEMADIENRLTCLESSVNEILVEIRGIKLEILAAKGESDAAAPLLEQRLQKVESAVGLFELGKGVGL